MEKAEVVGEAVETGTELSRMDKDLPSHNLHHNLVELASLVVA